MKAAPKFRKGDRLLRKDTKTDMRVVSDVQDVRAFEYRLDDKTYWWSAAAIENNFDLEAILHSPLYKALE